MSAATSLAALWLGAKLGAILCGAGWMSVDTSGTGSLQFWAGWTAVDTDGHGLEIYGSGGCVFESRRARC